MTVKTILSTKGDDVTTIEPTATLAAAIGLLAERRIGALVVLGANHRVIGILSERDIVRTLAERGAGAGALTEPLRLVGIVSIGDVVKHRLMQIERESEALRSYIQTA
jgi:CBS domain-containing protein